MMSDLGRQLGGDGTEGRRLQWPVYKVILDELLSLHTFQKPHQCVIILSINNFVSAAVILHAEGTKQILVECIKDSQICPSQ